MQIFQLALQGSCRGYGETLYYYLVKKAVVSSLRTLASIIKLVRKLTTRR